MRIVALAIAMVMMLGGPAAAGTPQNPEWEDTCGVGTNVVHEQVAPWLDLCGAWFETVSASEDTSEIKVTVEVADLLAQRVDSQYRVGWTAGGCSFDLVRFDGGKELAPGDPHSWLQAQCDPGHEVPCPTPLKELGYTCWEWDEDPQYIDVSDSFSESGNRLSWTLRFDGPLAAYAKGHAEGAVLRAGDVRTTVGVNSAPFTGPGYCTGASDGSWECQNQVTDWIPDGRNYVVGS